MFYHLFKYLDEAYNLPGSGVFQYISFRSAAAIILALLIGIIFGRMIIDFLRRKQIGEDIRDLGLEGQLQKKGTPTMGGVIILLSILVPTLLFGRLDNIYIQLMLISTVWLGFIGGLDDYIKVFRHHKEGLKGRFKVVGQIGLGLIVGTTMWLSSDIVVREEPTSVQPTVEQTASTSETMLTPVEDVKTTKTTIPFFKDNELDYSWFTGGNELLAEPVKIETWAAHGYNQLDTADDRRSAEIHNAIQKTYSTEIKADASKLSVECKVSLGGPAVVPIINGTLTYNFYSDGKAEIAFNGEFRQLLKEMNMRLPRFGFCFALKGDCDNMTYFGKGPIESYCDRHKGTRFGLFETTAAENFVHYIRPIENGSHFACAYAKMNYGNGSGIEFRPAKSELFCFNATHFTPKMLENAKHDDELVPSENTYVYLDYKLDSRSGRGIYETLEPERKWDFEPIEFSVEFKPVK